jgi:uncharacterized protein YndB with AHSA1/START domain
MLSETIFGVKMARPSVVMTRLLRAPRELVFDALVEPEYLARWSGPREFRQSACEVELWRGGAYRSVLRAPDGKVLTLRGTYGEVTRPERLVYTERFDLEPHSSHEHVVGITLAERDGATDLLLTEGPRSVEDRWARINLGAWEANLHCLERLAELVESMGPAHVQGNHDRDWTLVPFECDDRVQAPEPPAGRGRTLGRFAALFGARS